MAKTISRLLNNIVLKLNRILNKALKTYRLLIVLQFIDIAKAYFTIGYYPKLKKAIITFILHKKGKADYLFPGSYRPITLKNTLSKILERVIVDHIADTAKEHALLPQSQIGVRKNCLILLVFILLTATIKSAQVMRRNFIILILSLNISGVYNNIPHKCFLYICRAKGLRVQRLKRNIISLQWILKPPYYSCNRNTIKSIPFAYTLPFLYK